VQHTCVVAFAEEVEQVYRAFDVYIKSLPEIGIEVRQPRTVDYNVERWRYPIERLGFDPKIRLCYIAFDHFNAFAQKARKV